ncbi:MAG: UbiA family prenyltransferase [Deltaproteobacteria bacterium]|nr:UbiA family prenyltransferase [Deltaproteobacteria bacterium]
MSIHKPSPKDYLAICRLDHVTKHVFIIPGICLAYILRYHYVHIHWTNILLGCIVALSIASANYAINEWLDRNFDKFHPGKSGRTAVQFNLDPRIVWLMWGGLILLGLGAAWSAGKVMFIAGALFVLQGIFYNVPPLRSKDRAYLDVVSESINNPIRLTIGWAMIDATTLPPASIILAYWLGGAFLMAAKRLSEYRETNAGGQKEKLEKYRKSFVHYNELSLLISCVAYAMMSNFFMAVFFIKYRVEFIILLPVTTLLFCYYLAVSMKPGSVAQKPEYLLHERNLIIIMLALFVLFIIALFVDIPIIETLAVQKYIVVP